jgi:hypothetical protein
MRAFGCTRITVVLGLAIATWSLPAAAQSSASGPTLTGLSNFEQSLAISNTLPSGVTVLPSNVLAAITTGGLDFRSQTNYNPAANLLTLTFFTVQPGAPTPTNLGQINPSNVYGGMTINVDKTYVTSKAVMFVGTVSSSATNPFGSFQGAPASLSFAYSSDTPPKITNSILVVAGNAVVFSPTATGTVSITQPPGGGGGGGTTGVTIVVNGGPGVFPNGTNTFQTSSNLVTIDASQSTSSNTGALTYSWVAVPSGMAGIYFSNTATPVIQLFNKGSYTITVTVTDAKGATATQTITIQYV